MSLSRLLRPQSRLHLTFAAAALLALTVGLTSFADPPPPAPAPAPPPAVPALAADEPPPVTHDALQDAVEKARDFLSARMNAGNNWESVPAPVAGDPGYKGRRWGEITALSLAAIQSSGVNVWGSTADAVTWLRKAETDDPVVASWRAPLSCFRADRDPALRRLCLADRDRLIRAAFTRGPAAGLFPPPGEGPATRPTNPAGASVDLDDSQAAVRGLYAIATESPLEVPPGVWATLDAGWRRAQKPDGSWAEQGKDSPADRLAATADAAATLLLIRDVTRRDGADCKPAPADAALDTALSWLDVHAAGAFGSDFDPAALYALERVGMLTGRTRFGGIDWYARGVDLLLKRQKPDGSWPDAAGLTGADPAGRDVPETAWATMFLSEARLPVVMTRLVWPSPGAGAGDPRPDDVSHFVRWAGQQACSVTFGWQRAEPGLPLRDLLNAPILYVSGSGAPAFTPAQEQALRDYALHGGLIVGNAACRDADFATAFTAFGARLFPGCAFRPLPADHVIHSRESFRAEKWPDPHPVAGLSNGVRELMLLIPDADLSKAWQTRATASSRREQYQIGFDILAYATGYQLMNGQLRGEPPPAAPLRPDPRVKADRLIRVARLSYPGNCDPEPAGWQRLANVMHDECKTDLEITPVTPGEGKLASGRFQVAHLTGTAALVLTPASREELAAFVNRGGTLVVDAAGGSAAFADSVEPVLPTFAAADAGPGAVLPKDHPVYSAAGDRIEKFEYRRFCRGKLPGKLGVPRVRGIDKGGRVAVFYSREDLTAGLVGSPTDGILGYAPDTATAIMRNLLLYAAARP